MLDSKLSELLKIEFINCLPENNPFRGGYETLQHQFKHFLNLKYDFQYQLELDYYLRSVLHDPKIEPLIIHVFCHSNQLGIMSDQSGQRLIMTWEAFVDITNQINTARNNGLTIIVTGCESYNSITATSSSRAFIGYENDLHFSVAHSINSLLYSNYALKGCNIIDSAVLASSKYPALMVKINRDSK
ncbi:MAG: hypothetical protein CVU48_04090 [Candidatus Cloacimonetes bacterium HGW-Cloacimonetes-1]|jgi:hypothetical protein|nr:MAG: hypothetical protein CVU48_04090 [Candidatus Cloacimonetes bacterium HGW-Cloacimonetes-1]